MNYEEENSQYDYLANQPSYLDQLSGNQAGGSLEALKPIQYDSMQQWRVFDPQGYQSAISQLQEEQEQSQDPNYFLTDDKYIPGVSDLTTFVGSALWGATEAVSMGALTALNQSYRGEIGKAFGYEAWENAAVSGKAGYLAGSIPASLYTLGLTGKGLRAASGAMGIGQKTLAKFGAKQIAKGTDDILSQVTKASGMSDDVATDVFQLANKSIKEGTDEALAAAETWKTSSRIKKNPFGDSDLRLDIQNRTRIAIKSKLDDMVKAGDDGAEWAAKVGANPNAIDNIVNESLKQAQQYGHLGAGNFSRALAIKLGDGKAASYVGDAVYESILLATHSAAHTIIGNYSADALDLSEEEYQRRSWMKDALFSAVTGWFFPAVRRIGGGKDVQIAWDGMIPRAQSGSLKDFQTMTKALWQKLNSQPKITWDNAAKTFGKDSQFTPKQVQTMLRNIYNASGKSDDVFRNAGPGFNISFLTDSNALNHASSLKALYNAYKSVTKDALKIAVPMMKEIGKDLTQSMFRMVPGTVVMNAHTWHETDWDHYPADKMVVDVITGMLFMKRKHRAPGEKLKDFYGSGEYTGAELAKYAKTLDILNYDKKTLDYYAGVYSTLDVNEQLAKQLVGRANKSTQDRRDLSAMVEKDKLNNIKLEEDITTRTARGEDVRSFEEHGALNYTKKIQEAKRLRDQGRDAEAKAIEQQATKELAEWDIARKLVASLELGVSKESIRHMTETEAIDFIKKLNSIKWKGKEVTHENVDDFLRESRIAAVNEVTADIQGLMEGYIKNSLNALGMWNDAMVQKGGRINVHKDVLDVLDIVNKDINHAKSAEVLKAVLHMADKLNIIRLGEEGIKFESSRRENPVGKETLDLLTQEYKAATDLMHDKVFNDGMSNWRNVVPGKTKEGFLDVNILAATPIWDAMHTNMLHMRNAVGYDLVTGRNLTGMKDNRLGDLHDKIDRELYEGNANVAIKDVPSSKDVPHVQEVLDFINHYNQARKLTGRETGTKEIEFTQAEKFFQEVKAETGSIFTNKDHFAAFKDYMYQEYLTEVTGSDSIGRSLRRAVNMILDRDNPMALRNDQNGTTTMPSSKALEQVLLGNVSEQVRLSAAQTKEIRDLIEIYRQNIENTLKDKGNIIKFSDDLILSEASIYTRKDWQRQLTNMVTQIEGDKLFRMGHLMKNLDILKGLVENPMWSEVAHYKSLNDIAANKKEIEVLQREFADLRMNTLKLVELISNAAQYGDVTLLRTALDQQFNLERALVEVNEFTANKKAYGRDTTLGSLASQIDVMIKDIIKKRNDKLGIDSYNDVQKFIESQSEINRYSDSAGRIVTERQTVSENVYLDRYQVGDRMMDMLRGNLKSTYDNFDGVSAAVKAVLNNPAIKNQPSHIREAILENLDKIGLNEQSYITQIVEPQLAHHWNLIKNTKKVKDANLTYSQFITDTFQLLTSSGGSSRVQIATYKGGGKLDLSTATVSNWNKGFNALIDVFGFDASPGSFLLVSQTHAAQGRLTSRLDMSTIAQIRADVGAGIVPKFKMSELLTAAEQNELAKLVSGNVVVGSGRRGAPQYGFFSLDSKTMVMINHNKYKSIIDQFRNQNSDAYNRFKDVLGPETVEAFIRDHLKIDKVNLTNPNESVNSEVIETVLRATRLAFDRPDVLRQWANGTLDPNDLPKVFKYYSLSSPKSGLALNQRVLKLTDAFVDRMFVNDPELVHIREKYMQHRVDAPKHRKFIIFDEKDPSGKTGFFDAYTRHRDRLERQLIEEFGMAPEVARETATRLAEKTKAESKSTVDGEVFLSLPEMISMLVPKGADKSWFVWDKGEIVGFNVAIKPVVSHSEVGKNGSMTVVMDKTAFKFDPVMDKAMRNADGKYWTDSIAFRSAVKVGKKSNGWGLEPTDIGVGIKLDTPLERELGGRFSDWKEVVAKGLGVSPKGVINPGMVEIDRANILLKSISGKHKGTVSVAYGNFLSNDAQKVLDNWLGSTANIFDLTRKLSAMKDNPYALLQVGREMSRNELQSGDRSSRLSGLEFILSEGGLPTYEFMRPQIEKSLTSYYMNTQNFVNGEIKFGGYNVMTAGSGLSDPIRHAGIQTSFGGSAVPHFTGEQVIGHMLSSTHADGIPLVMKLSTAKAQELNRVLIDKIKKTGLKLEVEDANFFAKGEEYLGLHSLSGDMVTGPIIGKINRIILDGNRTTNREIDQTFRNKINTAVRETLIDVIAKDYRGILKNASIEIDKSNISYSDFVKYLDRGFDKNLIETSDQLNREYRVKTGKNANSGYAATKTGYDGIFASAIDLRTPKDGINSWVISKVEKILDKRRGAVSEINQADAINPQDADFDLDKSAQFTTSPSKVVEEIYGGAGYHQKSSIEILKKAGMELKIEGPTYEVYVNEMLAQLDSQRAPLVRQHSIASFIMQYFSSVNEARMYNILKPGYRTGVDFTDGISRVSNSIHDTAVISEFKGSNDQLYKVSFREAGEFVDSVQFMKSMIKEMIDVHGSPKDLGGVNTRDFFWFSNKVGLFKIQKKDFKSGKYEEINWNDMSADVRAVQKGLSKHIVKPLNDIFNLKNGVETLSDGSSRKLTVYDYVSIFNKAKWEMSRLKPFKVWDPTQKKMVSVTPYMDRNKRPMLESFANDMLAFLGDGWSQRNGTANHPLIKGLNELSKALDKQFTGRDIQRNDLLANLIEGKMHPTDEVVSKALKEYVRDEQKWVELSSVRWEINRLSDILNDMQVFRQDQTNQYRKKQARLERLSKIMDAAETEFNNTYIGKAIPKTKRGGYSATEVTRVYKLNANKEVIDFTDYRPGEFIKFNRGDVVIENPRRYVISDNLDQDHRRAMYRAFGNRNKGVSEFDAFHKNGYIRELKRDLFSKIGDLNKNSSDQTIRDSQFYSDISEMELSIMRDVYNKAKMRGDAYATQFLWSLLTPKVNQNVVSIMNYDAHANSYFNSFYFNSNKRSEKLVVSFLSRAMEGKVPEISPNDARSILKNIDKRKNLALVKEWGKTLDGEAFRMVDRDIERNITDFRVLPERSDSPHWNRVDVKNESARRIMQSYMTGSYRLDPIELYRLTAALDKTNNSMIDVNRMSELVKGYWTDISDIDLGRGSFRYSRRSMREKMELNREYTKKRDALEAIEESACGL